LRLLKGLRAKGFDVALASDRRIEGGGPIQHFPVKYPPGRGAVGEIKAALETGRPDVVHAIGGGLRLLTACDAACAEANVPWVCTVHNVPPAERIFPLLLRVPKLHYALRDALALPSTLAWRRFLRRGRFARAICHSETVAGRLGDAGCGADRVSRVPLGCDAKPPCELTPAVSGAFADDASPKILTVAGFAPHKGQLDSLEVVRRLLPEFPRLCYRMIGMSRDRRYTARVRRNIRDAGLDDHAAIIHAAPEATKWAALREADLYLQPSHEEGFCLAFLEAAVCVPRVVGTRTGEMPAIVGQDLMSRVVDVRNVDAAHAASRELLAARIDAVPANRRDRLLATYSWDAYLDSHAALYASVCAAR
jgi:glycosyltransferase involved in cell wall biosynthesis